MELRMIARSVGSGGQIAVTDLEALPDYDDETAPGGTAHIIARHPEDLDLLVQGKVYIVTIEEASGDDADAGVAGQSAELAAQVAAIPNSTNTVGYKTPRELKVPPPRMPDGTVTLPRPSVVVAPVTDTPPDAGVSSGPATNPAPQAGTATATTTPTPAKTDGDKPDNKTDKK